MDKSALSYRATSQGYTLLYRGNSIGGAGASRPFKGHGRAKKAVQHAASAKCEIAAIKEGRGQSRFLAAIAKIDE